MKIFLFLITLLLPNLLYSQFSVPKSLIQTNNYGEIFTYDYDGDQLEDIMVKSYSDYFIICKNLGQGSFKTLGDTVRFSESTGTLAIADIDNDDDLDILGVSYGKVMVLEYNAGSYTERQIVFAPANYSNSLSVADYDNDGDVDVFITDAWNTLSISYLENVGNLNFKSPVVWLNNNYYWNNKIRPLDFNMDGLADMTLTDYQNFKIFINKGSMQFDTVIVSKESPGDSNNIQMTDIDLDGDNDFVRIAFDNVYVYEQLEGQKFGAPKPLFNINQFIREGILLDKDDDGDLDLVLIIFDNMTGISNIHYIENLGGGLFSQPVILPTNNSYYVHLSTMDVNNDSNVDLIYMLETNILWAENTDRKMNIISGKAYFDKNNNCIYDGEDEVATNTIVKAGSFYNITDSEGNYKIAVDLGTYSVNALFNIPTEKLISYCSSPQQMYITVPGSVYENINFGAQVKLCPELNVNISSSRRRRCFPAITTITYSNTGTATAESVKVKVVYPTYVKFQSASASYTTLKDSLYTFNVGNLLPGASASIVITDSVVCGIEEIRGLSQCTKAFISTTSSCTLEDTQDEWDKSSISVTGSCNKSGDRVIFSIKNGDDSGDMADSSEYRVYYNDTLVYTDKFKLEAGESHPVSVPAYGQTVRLEADQHPLHPGKSRPREIIEACGSSLVNAKKGFVVSVPQDDLDHDVDISCMEIIDSYDPNDKLAEPSGYGASNFILPGERIEYTIRFQNTGKDTAYKIIVVDTLMARYDISSLEILGASHPYKVSVTGSEKPVIRWVFNNIMLPDSFVNEPASNGYLKFAIRSEANLEEGVSIANFADIFFDYNSAIRTNTYLHETNYFIPEDKSKGLGITELDAVNSVTQKTSSTNTTVYPNPFNDKITFKVNSTSPFSLQLFSSTGEQVKAIYNITSKQIELDKEELKAGIYMFTISSEKDGVIATGKIVAVD